MVVVVVKVVVVVVVLVLLVVFAVLVVEYHSKNIRNPRHFFSFCCFIGS